MATRKQLITGVASVAVIGIISILGYKLAKEISKFNIDENMWENFDDAYNYRTSKNRQSSSSDDECQKLFL